MEELRTRSLYTAAGKRTFDLLAAAIALFILLPVFLLIALLLKLTSAGPVFYRQERVGKEGHNFRIAKFRTMAANAEKRGPSITIGGDPRITPLGRIMRALKLDELPQLWNVLRGEMSLVGPRPEIPIYVQNYNQAQTKVLAVRPGITDPGSIAYWDEEKLLAQQACPETYYLEVVLPHKLVLNLEYIRRISWKYDLWLLTKTCFRLFSRRPLISLHVAGKASSANSWQIKSSN